MFLLDWYREYLELKYEVAAKKRELRYCESCESLSRQLALANDERKYLIEKLTETKVVTEEVKPSTENLKAVMPTSLRWSARQQILEAEDRQKAKALKNNPSIQAVPSGVALTAEEIEKELGVEKNG